ncbi:MAG: hypothetical protein FWC21_06025 [Treponema sp.]|nr:hypothetical protein [Treponema sp.]
MNRRISLFVLIFIIAVVSASAQALDMKIPVFKSVSYFAVAVPGDADYSIPLSIANNQYYLESVRLSVLAETLFQNGDYENSTITAQNAIREALKSDEFVAVELINETERLINWAYYNNLHNYYPYEYSQIMEYYEASLIAHSDTEFNQSIGFSINSIEILSSLQLPAAGTVPPPPLTGTGTGTGTGYPAAIVTPQQPGGITATGGYAPLPSQYTVRPWATTGDCLWNIAAYPWVYNDPYRWPELFEANRSRMPQPDNPDLIHPGFIINIPSSGEVRQGMWDPSVNYGF